MKLLLGLLVSLAISSAFALPAYSPKDEVDVVEPRRETESEEKTDELASRDVDPGFRDFQGVVDTGAGYPFLAPLPHAFSFNLGFFDSFEDIFRRLRARFGNTDSGESSEELFPLGWNPPKGANATSVVKFVDGHKVEINDTIYGTNNGRGDAVYKFRIINIRPLESGEEVEEGEAVGTQATTTEYQTTPSIRDIEGQSDEKKDSSEEVKPDENEINANIDNPESTTEAITTEMHDTVPHRIPSFDNNAVDNDSPVNQDELQVDGNDGVDVAGVTTEAAESLNDDVATLAEDNTNPDSYTGKSEKLSALVDPENVNDGSEDVEQNTKSSEEYREINDSIVENRNAEVESFDELQEQGQKLQEVLLGQRMQELVDTVGEKLSMANEEDERFADEVEKMLSAIDGKDSIEESQKLYNPEHHSLREDLSSSDDEEDEEDVNEGLNAEWGGMDDKNILTNEIDVYESVPIDLSNDIAINDILADQGAPVNPDAEVFNVDEFASSAGEFMAGRRFEVLRDIK